MNYKHRDSDWNIPDEITWEKLPCALLLDIREELKGIRRRLDCTSTLEIPHLLKMIKRNTAPKRRKNVRRTRTSR